jgi:hypothetical protein
MEQVERMERVEHPTADKKLSVLFTEISSRLRWRTRAACALQVIYCLNYTYIAKQIINCLNAQ